MKRSNQRKLRSQARTIVQQMTQLANREVPSEQETRQQQSISPIQPASQSFNQYNANTSFYSVSSVPIEDFNIVQTESLNLQSQSSDSSEHSSEDNYSSLIISHSGSSYYSFSRSSSLSLSRGNSFIGTESVYSANNRSRASSPFVISETSSGYNSEIIYHSAISSANQSYVSHDENSINGDSSSRSSDRDSCARQLSGVQLLESSAASVVQEESEKETGNENNNVRAHIEEINQHSEFFYHSLNRIKFILQEGLYFIIWMILSLYRIIIKYLFDPVRNKLTRLVNATRGRERITTISPRDANQNNNTNSTMTNSNIVIRAQPNLIKWLFSSAGLAVILIVLYRIPCNLTNIQNLELSKCISKIHNVFRQNGNLSNYSLESLNDDIEFDHNDLLIRDVVADQVKTVCAAEVQKRIPSQNYDLVRYRSNRVSDDDVVNMVRQEIRKAVEEMLYTYSQDKLNKADFALSTGGAKIISPLTSPTYEQWPTQWYKMAFAKLTGHGITRGKPPVTALQPDVHVGQCWPFAGQKGQLAVLLSRQIYVTAVTYDHVSKTIAMGTTSAPKEFEIWGFADDEQDKDNFDNEHSEHTNTVTSNNYPTDESDSNIYLHLYGKELKLGSSPNHLFFGRFVYDINGLPVQTFEVNRLNKPVKAIIMKSNFLKMESRF
ncbi:unnamed protein product [Rhizophagus irregularis]|uniref:SUN domain-containing protein n=1 Tax=Rhizophagus irregularis TaxID=588596 RepID=A0A915YTY0_9GLOM|nr:unnamed protein product [Rhizophagus irregularis]CAB5191971.1 unnamed protein product [Rhizophagus irregularis]CAB5336490.1 unnamed protein product [Rhizophagus irregularis]